MDTMSYLLGKKSGGGSGTSNYSDLTNKPKINNVELSGNKSSSDLSLQDTLVSGTNIKTINNTSLLGSGNINISSENQEIYTLNINANRTTEDTAFLTSLYSKTEDELKRIILIDTNDNPLTERSIYKYNTYGNDYKEFYSMGRYYFNSGNQITEIKEVKTILKIYNNGNITTGNSDTTITKFLSTGKNYGNPYVPTYAGSPATKKYVDDAIGTALNSSY